MNGVKEGVDGAVTIAGDIEGVAVTLQRAGEGDLRVLILVALLEVALGEAVGAVELEVFPLKQVQNVGGLQLVTDVSLSAWTMAPNSGCMALGRSKPKFWAMIKRCRPCRTGC